MGTEDDKQMKKKILVTGAGGYIGRHVVSSLLDMGADVVAVDLYTDGIDSRATVLQEDIFAAHEGIFQRLGSPEACIHLAWRDGFVHQSDAHMMCLSDHVRFIRQITTEGLKQLAIMGTMHEIGYWEGPIDENTPCNPQSLYGIAKDALRRAVFAMFKGTDVKVQWLRAYYIFGDDSRSVSIFGKLLAAAERGDKFFPFTTGKNKYDFISVEELGKLLALCVMQNEVTGIINCCTGKPVSLAEEVEWYIKSRELNIQLQYGAFSDRPYDSPGVWGDVTQLNRVLKVYGHE